MSVARRRASDQVVAIELDQSQVDQVVRAASDGGALSVVLARMADRNVGASHELRVELPSEMKDRRLSHSLLTGLFVLASMPTDGSYVGIGQIARATHLNTSTTHRYVTTLVAVALVERDPRTRRYRAARSRPSSVRG